MKAWHERYESDGLRTIGVHTPGFEVSKGEQAVRGAVERLGISYPVLIDSAFEVWEDYGNEGWPARYLLDGRGRLFEYHFGEGAYAETELAIQELLAVERGQRRLRREDRPGAELAAQTADQPGAYSGRYEAGGVWAVLDGVGTVRVRTAAAGGEAVELSVAHPGAYPLIEHDRHTIGSLELEIGPGVKCVATCFTPGVI